MCVSVGEGAHCVGVWLGSTLVLNARGAGVSSLDTAQDWGGGRFDRSCYHRPQGCERCTLSRGTYWHLRK